jgi:hypothetical protein
MLTLHTIVALAAHASSSRRQIIEPDCQEKV